MPARPSLVPSLTLCALLLGAALAPPGRCAEPFLLTPDDLKAGAAQVTRSTQESDARFLQLEKRLKDQQAQSDVAMDENKKALEKANADIQDLVKKLNDTSNAISPEEIKTYLAMNDQRLKQLEELNARGYHNQIAHDQLRFEAGLQLLAEMTGNVEKLDFAVTFGRSLSSYANATNPTTNPVFIQLLTDLEQTGGNKESGLSKLLGGLVTNPIITAGIGIASLFGSKKPSKDKTADLETMNCVTSLSLKANGDFQVLQNDLNDIDFAIKKFKTEATAFFPVYVGSVGAQSTYKEFKDADPLGDNPVMRQAQTFFAQYQTPADPTVVASGEPPPDIARVRFAVESLRAFVDSYESLVRQMDGYLGKFTVVMERRKAEATCPAVADLKTKLDGLIQENNANRDLFNSAWGATITPAKKRILYTSN